MKKRIKKPLSSPLRILSTIVVFSLLTGSALFLYFIKDLPRPEVFTESEISQVTKIYDRKGEIVLSSVYGEEKRTYVPLSDVPDHLQKAVIATEDANFYNHWGVDFAGVLRSIRNNFVSRGLYQGGSTITQQLIRSTFLTLEKSIERKIKELVLSIELDRRYSKDQILEWYFNQVPFGVNIYGAQEAALTYFQKPVKEVSLAEAALLAATIQAPSYYSPYGSHLENLLARKDYVLERMEEEGFISQEEKEGAQKEELKFNKLPKTQAVHFVEFVKQQLEDIYGSDFLEIKGLKIYTTLDWELQQFAETTLKEQVASNRINFNAYNSALVAIDPKTGEILAMIGSADPWDDSLPEGCDPTTNCKFVPSYNVAVQGERMPGSSFKPFIYAEAFKKGYNDLTVVVDELTNFGTPDDSYIPHNYDGFFRGPVTLRSALAQSLNIPSVKVLRDLAGLEDSIALAKRMGITTLDRGLSFYGLSLVLGGGDVKLLDMVSAYSVFANGGYRIEPSPILRIEDSQGNIIYENKKTPRKVLEKNVCDLITDILSDNAARAPIFGWNSNLRFDNPKVAAKTGTTNDNIDGWTLGYTPDVCVGVWSGNNDNTSMTGAVGESSAGPIWRKVMEKAIEIYSSSD
ncbi:MAG: PBP1A family penicillin-binding protein [Candidatus Paceibacterota bacterium]|jgi:1A family penicillin-binding protein|nr:PBP1A family penicillin-binding protein [Candidatus Paceibacterota bacterium]MDD5555141.1 PBP1A family penicillin-binding protein [Candidatus Paceibacterota bacterium]